jgi:hypothetical protein
MQGRDAIPRAMRIAVTPRYIKFTIIEAVKKLKIYLTVPSAYSLVIAVGMYESTEKSNCIMD